MRRTTLIIMLVALAGCSHKGADTPVDGLQAANTAYDRALIDGDAAAIARFYTDDFTIIDDDGNIRGKQEQVQTMSEVVDLLEARSDDVKVTPLGSNAALLTGRFTGRYRIGEKENTFTERYTSVWVREDGEWKVRHEHASLVPEPERQPAPDA